MADYGNDWTEEQLEELERRIYETYKLAKEEMQEKVNAYFERFRERDEENRKRLEAGEITEEYYKQWRLAQIGRGQRMEALRDEYARRMNEANKVAAAYINDVTPGIYSLNENYAAYTIEQVSGNVGFNLINEQAVRRLIVEQPELFYRPVIDTPFDIVWNQKKLTSALTAGILQGESIGKIANRFQDVADMNRVSALRNARTAVTSAQNAGIQASYDRALEMGLDFLGKRWVATKDLRTRESHAAMDGKIVPLDGYFETPLGSIMQYPGDMSNARPGDIYNCRCRTVSKEKPGIEAEPREMRVRDPITGKNELISEMTYQEWYAWKQGQDPEAFALAEKKQKNQSADLKQFEKYRKVLGGKFPKTLEGFQRLKYEKTEAWEAAKKEYTEKKGR